MSLNDHSQFYPNRFTGAKAYLEAEEIGKLEKAATNLRDRLLITLLSHLGCRISEALGIKVEDVDLLNHTVTIQHLKARIQLCCPQCGARLGRSGKPLLHRVCYDPCQYPRTADYRAHDFNGGVPKRELLRDLNYTTIVKADGIMWKDTGHSPMSSPSVSTSTLSQDWIVMFVALFTVILL